MAGIFTFSVLYVIIAHYLFPAQSYYFFRNYLCSSRKKQTVFVFIYQKGTENMNVFDRFCEKGS